MEHLMKYIVLIYFFVTSCDYRAPSTPQSSSGVRQARVEVETGPDGLTAEQRNIRDRLAEDNRPGSVKHLYIISAFSGQVILYSTVRGKVTSSGKRLTPTTVAAIEGEFVGEMHNGVPVNIGGRSHYTSEVLQDDGTYGSSVEYLYWWDQRGVYHQHYISGGQIVHVSDKPITVPNIIINLETVGRSETTR